MERKQKKEHFKKQLEAAQAIYRGAAAPKISVLAPDTDSTEVAMITPRKEVTFSEGLRESNGDRQGGGYSEAITQMN